MEDNCTDLAIVHTLCMGLVVKGQSKKIIKHAKHPATCFGADSSLEKALLLSPHSRQRKRRPFPNYSPTFCVLMKIPVQQVIDNFILHVTVLQEDFLCRIVQYYYMHTTVHILICEVIISVLKRSLIMISLF